MLRQCPLCLPQLPLLPLPQGQLLLPAVLLPVVLHLVLVLLVAAEGGHSQRQSVKLACMRRFRRSWLVSERVQRLQRQKQRRNGNSFKRRRRRGSASVSLRGAPVFLLPVVMPVTLVRGRRVKKAKTAMTMLMMTEVTVLAVPATVVAVLLLPQVVTRQAILPRLLLLSSSGQMAASSAFHKQVGGQFRLLLILQMLHLLQHLLLLPLLGLRLPLRLLPLRWHPLLLVQRA